MSTTRTTVTNKLSSSAKPVISRKKQTTQVMRKITTNDISDEERHAMIAEAAYYQAEKHGFDSSRQLDDWLKAEEYVDSMLIDKEQQKAERHH